MRAAVREAYSTCEIGFALLALHDCSSASPFLYAAYATFCSMLYQVSSGDCVLIRACSFLQLTSATAATISVDGPGLAAFAIGDVAAFQNIITLTGLLLDLACLPVLVLARVRCSHSLQPGDDMLVTIPWLLLQYHG